MPQRQPIAWVSVINDLASDHRVHKACFALQEEGYRVKLIGRALPHSPAIANLPFECIRMRMVFTKGPLFYFFFNLRLFFRLATGKASLLYFNDLDTLGPN